LGLGGIYLFLGFDTCSFISAGINQTFILNVHLECNTSAQYSELVGGGKGNLVRFSPTAIFLYFTKCGFVI
jgi:hypothetical protein